MNILPRIHKENIVVQHANDEVLIYFFDTNKAVCLNSTSAIVFNHCDGKTTFDELKSKYNLNDDLIYFTLDKLNENNILKEYQANTHFAGLSRRDVIKRIGLGSMIALPVISSLIVPTAARASSTGANPLTACSIGVDSPGNGTECRSGNCYSTQSNLGTANGALSARPNKCCVDNSNSRDRDSGHNLNNPCAIANIVQCCSGAASPGGLQSDGVTQSCLCN